MVLRKADTSTDDGDEGLLEEYYNIEQICRKVEREKKRMMDSFRTLHYKCE